MALKRPNKLCAKLSPHAWSGSGFYERSYGGNSGDYGHGGNRDYGVGIMVLEITMVHAEVPPHGVEAQVPGMVQMVVTLVGIADLLNLNSDACCSSQNADLSLCCLFRIVREARMDKRGGAHQRVF